MNQSSLRPFLLERYFSKYEFKTKFVLSASDCESLTMPELLAMADDETLGLWNNLSFGYTETAGHPRLLAEIAKLYKAIAPNEILVAAPEELIFLAMNVLVSKGDEVIVTTPAYQSLHEISSSRECYTIPWELQPDASGWKLDLQFLSDRLSDRTKLLVINFPHNPTGHHLSKDEQTAIIRLAGKFGVPVFSDEMYRGAEYNDEDRLPAVADLYEKGISLCGLSKSFALPGLRIGWLASKDVDVLARCSAVRDYITICSSAPSEILGMMALKASERILQRTRRIIAENLNIADDFFGRHAKEFNWLRPKAGSVAFPLLNKHGSIEDFCNRLVETRNLLITPGSLFQYPGNHFRIGLGRKNFPEAMNVLEGAL